MGTGQFIACSIAKSFVTRRIFRSQNGKTRWDVGAYSAPRLLAGLRGVGAKGTMGRTREDQESRGGWEKVGEG